MFYPNLSISQKYLVGAVINCQQRFIYREITAFVKHIKKLSRQYELDSYLITHGCLQGSAEKWYQEHLVHVRDRLNNGSIEQFCFYLIETAEQARRAMQQQVEEARCRHEAEQARLANERAERLQQEKDRQLAAEEEARLAVERQRAVQVAEEEARRH